MSLRSSILAAVAAVLLLLVLGNPFVGDAVLEDPPSWAPFTATTIVGSLSLGLGDAPYDQVGPSLLRAVLFVGAAFVLGGIAGRGRAMASLVGGWGAALGALTIGMIAFDQTVDADRRFRSGFFSETVDQISNSAATAAVTSVWLGWVIGLAVLLGHTRGLARPAPTTPAGSPAYGASPYGTPPPAPNAAPAPVAPTAAPGPAAAAPPFAPAPVAPAPVAPPTPPAATPPPAPAPSPPPPAGGGGGPQIGPPPDRSAGTPPGDDPTVVG